MPSYLVQGLSTKALRFTGMNDDFLSDAFDKSPVFLHTIEIDGRLRIMIEVGEDTRAEQIRKVVPYALKLRDKLLEFQGAWIMGGDNLLLEELSERQKHGTSYKELAKLINEKVENHLREYLAYRMEVDKRYPKYKKEFKRDLYFYAFSTEFKHNCFSLVHSRDMLMALGLKEKDIEQFLRDGLEEIEAGRKPFAPDMPISQLKLIETLRTWRKGKKHKTIQDIKQKKDY